MSGPLLVLHSAESTNLAATVRWMVEQNIMSQRAFDPERNVGQQILPWSKPGRSLQNERGGVETNNRPRVYQLEIIMFAEEADGYSDQWYDNLAAEVFSICGRLDIPIRFPKPFLAYAEHPPSSFGENNGVRMSDAEWLAATGIVGHMHVPENEHGDPGDISRLISRLSQDAPPEAMIRSDDDAIRWVQSKLRDREFYTGAIDGDFGPKSRAAFNELVDRDEASAGALGQAARYSRSLEDQIADLRKELDRPPDDGADLAVADIRSKLVAFLDSVGIDAPNPSG